MQYDTDMAGVFSIVDLLKEPDGIETRKSSIDRFMGRNTGEELLYMRDTDMVDVYSKDGELYVSLKSARPQAPPGRL